jgi:hypothetical protein
MRHLRLKAFDKDSCPFCLHETWFDLLERDEAPIFFQAIVSSLSVSRAKHIFQEISLLSSGRAINEDLIAFSNGYYDFGLMKFYTLDEIEQSSMIALVNQTVYSFPTEYIDVNFEEKIHSATFFRDEIDKVPIFRDLFKQPPELTKVRLFSLYAVNVPAA